MNENIIKQPPLPNTVHFNHTRDNDKTEVMRITRDGVWVNPDMQVDETAKAVLDALDYQVKVLVQRAVEAEREKVAKWMMVQGYATGHGDTVEDLLKELGWQVAPVDAVNTSQKPVDKTAKREHEPFIYIREDTEMPFGGYEHCGQHDAGAFPVYLAPPKREWVGLTDEEVGTLTVFDGLHHVETPLLADFIRAIEAKLKEKNS